MVLIVAFTSNFIVGNAVLDETAQLYIITAMDSTFEMPINLFNIANVISSTLNYAALLVIINVINATNKNTEITQGTLDNKQNVSLKDDAIIMKVLLDLTKANNIMDATIKDENIAMLEQQIPITVKLSNTFIDFTSVDAETKIYNLNNFISTLSISLEEAKKVNDLFQIKLITATLSKAQSSLATLTKNIKV